jgi:GGDEF domain-containing protein/CHASE3 domain sensor protein
MGFTAQRVMNFFLPRALLEAMTPHTLFARLSIARKMLLGYMLLVVLTVAVVIYALAGFLRLHGLNDGVIRVDVPVQEAANDMLDAILAQDTYEKRYLILVRTDIRNLFWKRGEEFDNKLALLKSLPGQERFPLGKIEKLHRQYGDLFVKEMKLVKAGKLDEASELSSNELKSELEQVIKILKDVSADAKRSQEANMMKISHLGDSAFITTASLCVLSIVIGVLASLVVTNHIASSIGKLKVAAGRVAEGDFYADPHIDAQDEIGSLSEAFRRMGQRLGNLEEMYLDASPLTRLPGGIAIENVLKRRLESEHPLAFCVLDLDNFKAFNDHYGYAHGNDVIKETAHIIEDAVKSQGSPEDFVGHIGGDDFVVITTPAMMRGISAEIIKQFDGRIPDFYNQGDRKNGFIFGKSRYGEAMRFPLMTLSIAIVTNEQHKLSNPLETSELAAELKDYAKTIARSVYVVDKRRTG